MECADAGNESGRIADNGREDRYTMTTVETSATPDYTMGFSHYDPVPRPIQEKLMAEFKPAADED